MTAPRREDEALLAREPALPGMRLLLDEAALAERAGNAFPEPAVRSVRLLYLRYKPLTSVLAGYRLEHDDGATTRLYAKAFAPSAREKLAKAAAAAAARPDLVAGPGGDGVVVYRFPFDPALPALERLAGDDALRRRRLLGRMLGTASAGAPTSIELSTVRYKPERRYVGRVRHGRRVLSVRLYGAAEFGRAVAGSATLRPGETLALARPAGRSRKHRALAFAWLAGRPLRDAASDPSVHPALFARVGRALAELHAQEPAGIGPRPHPALRTAGVVRAAGHLLPRLARDLERLGAGLAARLVAQPEMQQTLHGDFYLDQVLLQHERVVLLDLDEVGRGDPAEDLGTFRAHLEADALLGVAPARSVDELIDGLHRGYRSLAPLDPARVDLFTAVGLVGLLTTPFRTRHPDWPDRTEALMERAGEFARRAGANAHLCP